MQSDHNGSHHPREAPQSGDASVAKGKRARRPRQEDIELLAYLKYLDAGQPEGCAMDHWLEAERQLSEE